MFLQSYGRVIDSHAIRLLFRRVSGNFAGTEGMFVWGRDAFRNDGV